MECGESLTHLRLRVIAYPPYANLFDFPHLLANVHLILQLLAGRHLDMLEYALTRPNKMGRVEVSLCIPGCLPKQ